MPLSRFSRRHRRTWNDKKPEQEVFLEEHRIPPKPPHYYDRKKGRCRMCGLGIYKDDKINKRSTWHPECADEYMMIYHPTETRKRLWQRDRGYCAGCGIVQPRKSRVHEEKWHVDHIKPLWEQKGVKAEDLDMSYYKLSNLQTLCKKCHRIKTNSEVHLKGKKKPLKYKTHKFIVVNKNE